jgi:hypothetical protein
MGKLLDRLTGRDVAEYGKTLARDLAKRYPPQLDNQPEKRVSANRITKVLEDAIGRAVDYSRTEKLGFIRKARLSNAFRWEMKDLGYSEGFIETATEALVVYLSRRTQLDAPQPKT